MCDDRTAHAGYSLVPAWIYSGPGTSKRILQFDMLRSRVLREAFPFPTDWGQQDISLCAATFLHSIFCPVLGASLVTWPDWLSLAPGSYAGNVSLDGDEDSEPDAVPESTGLVRILGVRFLNSFLAILRTEGIAYASPISSRKQETIAAGLQRFEFDFPGAP
jgi:hypothetical protein